MDEKVLSPSRKWKNIIIICAVVLLIPCGCVEYWLISDYLKAGFTENTLPLFIVLQIVIITFIVLIVSGLLQVFRSFLKIRESEFEYFSGFFKHVTISANQIKNWSITQQTTLNIHINYEDENKKSKTLKIEMIFHDNEVFGKWLKEHSKNVSHNIFSANETIEHEIKSNKKDVTNEDISKYKKISKYYNYIGIVLAVIPLILIIALHNTKNIIRISYLISILWFFLGLVLIKSSNEIVRIDEIQGQKYPSIMRGMFIGPLLNLLISSSCINMMLDFKIYLFVSILIYFIVLIILRFFNLKQIQFKKDKSKNEKISVGFFYIILLFVVFGNIPGINQMFSFSKNYESHYVTVIDKKGDDDIIVAPWINTDKQKSIEVSKSRFLKIETGDELEIFVNKGCLGISFYTYKKR